MIQTDKHLTIVPYHIVALLTTHRSVLPNDQTYEQSNVIKKIFIKHINFHLTAEPLGDIKNAAFSTNKCTRQIGLHKL